MKNTGDNPNKKKRKDRRVKENRKHKKQRKTKGMTRATEKTIKRDIKTIQKIQIGEQQQNKTGKWKERHQGGGGRREKVKEG